jgi:hypothetical protein
MAEDRQGSGGSGHALEMKMGLVGFSVLGGLGPYAVDEKAEFVPR